MTYLVYKVIVFDAILTCRRAQTGKTADPSALARPFYIKFGSLGRESIILRTGEIRISPYTAKHT